MNYQTSYIVSFNDIHDKSIELPILYFHPPSINFFENHKIPKHKNSIISTQTTTDDDRIKNIHAVLENIKLYFDHNWIVKIEHYNHKKTNTYSEYVLYEREWVFLNSFSDQKLNILNLNLITPSEFIEYITKKSK
ncbi:hypothetical protein Indivirus_5_36 [Indivirus ILV1]|uniref:Uncharacterized protein n=1 Tax=Indivirus ILV1 TaxID=1977633 RepID=A0A1V0SDX5_9VIRU|nr:hypothetical protein Indivirus_5_36 [Indivirus ILV1]